VESIIPARGARWCRKILVCEHGGFGRLFGGLGGDEAASSH
jgi:hypothetical protein